MATKATVHWLMGKPDPKTGDATHALAAVITHGGGQERRAYRLFRRPEDGYRDSDQQRRLVGIAGHRKESRVIDRDRRICRISTAELRASAVVHSPPAARRAEAGGEKWFRIGIEPSAKMPADKEYRIPRQWHRQLTAGKPAAKMIIVADCRSGGATATGSGKHGRLPLRFRV